jgi:hypothetical protein
MEAVCYPKTFLPACRCATRYHKAEDQIWLREVVLHSRVFFQSYVTRIQQLILCKLISIGVTLVRRLV